MIIATVSGNLVAAPKPVFKNAQGEVYGIRFGSSTYKKSGNQYEKHTVWCSGLVSKKKIETILDRLTTGTYVVAHAPDATIREYQTKDGTYRSEIDLRFCQVVEAGNLKQIQQNKQYDYRDNVVMNDHSPTPQDLQRQAKEEAQKKAQHQGVNQAPSYQQAPAAPKTPEEMGYKMDHLPF